MERGKWTDKIKNAVVLERVAIIYIYIPSILIRF